MRPLAPNKNPIVAETIDHAFCLLGSRFQRLAIAHKLNTGQQARTAHVSDPAMPAPQLPKHLQLIFTGFVRPAHQVLAFNHVKHRHTGSTGYWIATERRKKTREFAESLANGRPHYRHAQCNAVTDRLAGRNDIRHDAVGFNSPHMRSHSAKSALHLVGYNHAPSRPDLLANESQIIWRSDQDAVRRETGVDQ